MYNCLVRLLLPSILLLLLVACSDTGFDNDIMFPGDTRTPGSYRNVTPQKTQKLIEAVSMDKFTLPYAGLPRVSIATETLEDPEDVTTEMPGIAILYNYENAVSDTLGLTIRGRGNTSFSMPKKSFKVEFLDKVSPYGLPKNRDWALLANYGDKTLLKNHIAFKLSEWLGMHYSPRTQFVELYLNGTYRGIYQLSETIKVGKKRVNIPENQNSFLVEVDRKYRDDDIIVFNEREMPFRIRYPKDPSDETKETLRLHLDSLERYLEYIHQDYTLALDSTPDNWFDVDDFIRHYWIQEFAKNTDAIPLTSVFFTWQVGAVIRMGPIWDFDAAFGSPKEHGSPEGWYIRDYSWYRRMSKMPNIRDSIVSFWKNNRTLFEALPDSIDTYAGELKTAAQNNFYCWSEILGNTDEFLHTKAYDSYQDAVDDLKAWIRERIAWIDENIGTFR